MISVSCSTKFHAFALAEQLERHKILNHFYTIYTSKKDKWISQFNKRIDSEKIGIEKFVTFPLLAPVARFHRKPFVTNLIFDTLVASKLREDSRLFIGWSGMSLKSIKRSKQLRTVTVLERGSSHISNQHRLLEEEYKKLGIPFHFDRRVEAQELEEYELTDYITVPSTYAKRSFIERGFSSDKIFVNNFGASSIFFPSEPKDSVFTILYVGGLTVQKGLIYLFEALNKLSLPEKSYKAVFAGTVAEELKPIIAKFAKPHWQFLGHVQPHMLSSVMSRASVMVQPSLQEGLSMVIPQVLACGVPVIATTNTGGEDIITDGKDGFIVPIRSSDAIADKIEMLFANSDLLQTMQENARKRVTHFGTWDAYGDRYRDFVLSKIQV
jgi:glycosyltransferase involved in cell wall biosynthesis